MTNRLLREQPALGHALGMDVAGPAATLRRSAMERIAIAVALPALALLAFSRPAPAADIEAGKAKVAAVCSACHGANGISVADTIPNLAGQRTGVPPGATEGAQGWHPQEPGDERHCRPVERDGHRERRGLVRVAARRFHRNGQVRVPAQSRQEQRHLPGGLPADLRALPHHQLPGHAPGAVLLREQRRGSRRPRRGGTCPTARISSSKSMAPSWMPTASR